MSITRNFRKKATDASKMLPGIAFAIGLFAAAPAGAQEIEVGVGQEATATVLPGDPVSIPIVVDMSQASGQNLASLEITVTWDDTRMTYNAATTGDFGSVTLNESNTATGELIANLFSASGTTTSFTALTLDMNAQTTEGVTTVTVTVGAAGDEAGNDISSMVHPRDLNLCVGETGLLGDVNTDDAVNILDAQQMARRSAGLSVANEERMDSHGDVTEDGSINIIDAQQTARFGVGLSTSTRAGDPIPGGCNFAPQVDITSPAAGSTFSVGEQITFQGSATDTEDGSLTGSSLVWTSSLDGQIGTGESFSSSALSEGDHTITLDATDSDTNVGSASVAITVASGSLEVTASTVGEDIDPNGYTVTVDGGSGQALAVNGTTTFSNLTAGDHQVQLTDVAANCTVFGGNPRTVTVPQGGTATTTFEVDCDANIGNLDVVTNTTGTDLDPDGYTATLDGQLSQSAPTNGTVTFSNTSAGTHQVELTGVASNCAVTSTNPQSVDVASNGTGTATFDVSCDPLPGDLDVTTNTTGLDIDPDGYQVSVDGGAGQAIGVNATITIQDLSAGDHTVELTGVADNCTVDTSTLQNPRTVTVPSDGSTSTTFDVSCVDRIGDLEITTSTSGSDIDPDGYQVSVDGGAGQAIGVNATVTIADLPEGDHTVELTGVAQNCTVSGSNPRTETVTFNTTTSTTFTVDCNPNIGDLEVITSTTGSDLDADGYTVTLDGTLSQSVGANATATYANTSGGDHTVELTGVAPNCTVSGDNPRTVNVAPGGTTQTTFDVSCSANQGDVSVTTSTTGQDIDPDGYTLTVDGSDAQAVGVNATVTLSGLVEGDRQIGLTGVASNCTVTSTNPQTITVVADQTVNASFDVSCEQRVGDIRVSTATTGSDIDPDGYTAVIVDQGTSLDVGVNSAVTFIDLPEATYDVELTNVRFNCSVSGSNPVSATVTDGTTSKVDFEITCDPLPSNLIYFETDRDGNSEVYRMNPDGSGKTNLTNNTAKDAKPSVSPDGGQVAFASDRASGTLNDIWKMEANGSNPVNLTADLGGNSFGAAWSPDGSKILFTNIQSGEREIYVMDADGSNKQNLTNSVGFDDLGAWSPDGSQIAFATSRDGDLEVYTMTASGSNQTNISNNPGSADASPAWAPGGNKIVFSTKRDGNEEIYEMSPTGSNPVNLTNTPGSDEGQAFYSPDGSKIVFISTRDGNTEIYVMSSDGSGQTRITENAAVDSEPWWSN